MSDRASVMVTIKNRLGLHARPATAFVQHASACQAEITVRRSDSKEAVNGKSIMELLMLAATQGTSLEITATGADADAAIASLRKLVNDRFGEE